MKASEDKLSDLGTDNTLSRTKERHSSSDATSSGKRERKRRPNDTMFEDQTLMPEWVNDKYPDHNFFWENDEKQKIQIREGRDWEIVKDSSGNPVTRPGGRSETTDSVTMVLMAIPAEWFKEDNQKAEDQMLERTNSLRGGSSEYSQGLYKARDPSEIKRR